jgi:small subunit ribosomal protein S20
VKIIKKKTLRNKILKSQLKTEIKKCKTAIASGAANVSDAFKAAIKRIDKSVAKGILHKNNAARKKSKLAKKFNDATQG